MHDDDDRIRQSSHIAGKIGKTGKTGRTGMAGRGRMKGMMIFSVSHSPEQIKGSRLLM